MKLKKKICQLLANIVLHRKSAPKNFANSQEKICAAISF